MIVASMALDSLVATKSGPPIAVDNLGRVTDQLGRTANIVRRDWLTCDSVVHRIDRVLLAE
jgi:hypothetical protein